MALYFLSPTVAVQTVMTAATIFRVRMSFFIAAPRIRKITSFESVYRSFIISNTVIVFMWFFKTPSAVHWQKTVLVTHPKFLGVWIDISDYGFMCMILQ